MLQDICTGRGGVPCHAKIIFKSILFSCSSRGQRITCLLFFYTFPTSTYFLWGPPLHILPGNTLSNNSCPLYLLSLLSSCPNFISKLLRLNCPSDLLTSNPVQTGHWQCRPQHLHRLLLQLRLLSIRQTRHHSRSHYRLIKKHIT